MRDEFKIRKEKVSLVSGGRAAETDHAIIMEFVLFSAEKKERDTHSCALCHTTGRQCDTNDRAHSAVGEEEEEKKKEVGLWTCSFKSFPTG